MRALLLPAVLLAVALAPAMADDAPRAEPEIVVHLPVDEMDVLLEADRRGVVLRYEEYRDLLARARAQAAGRAGLPPADGALARAHGTIEVGTDDRVRLDLRYRVVVLAPGTSLVPFVFEGVALEVVEVSGAGRYEERDGKGRLRFDGPGSYDVAVRGWLPPQHEHEQRHLRVHLPPASAMAIDVSFPPAVSGHAQGEGQALVVATEAASGDTLRLRPSAAGRLDLAWGPAARSQDGPPLLDVQTRSFHGIEPGLIHTHTVVGLDVLRAPTDTFVLTVPAVMALRGVSGPGVVGSSRSEDRTRLVVQLESDVRGRIELVVTAETPFEASDGVELPRIGVEGALRERADVAFDLKPGVAAEDVRVEGGRRLASLRTRDGRSLLHYDLARADSRILVDLLPGDTVVEAASTYYLNLTEPAKTLVAAITYQVVKGKAFRLLPRFPAAYKLLDLRVDGQAEGFQRDRRADGTVEIRLAHGAAAGTRLTMLATLEAAGVDWVPEAGSVDVEFDVPRAGVEREEGYVGVGADASFQVLDTDIRGLVSVGAAELTSRGVTPAGLVYGYRLDGEDPGATLVVARRTPRIRAEVVARVEPRPRRLDVTSIVLHRIERAGVRRLLVDVPAWAGEDVRMLAPDIVASNRLDDAEGVPDGFVRWEVALAQRVLGDHRFLVRYGEDQVGDDWRIPDGRPLAARVPLDQVNRAVVVTRAPGLEVDVSADAVRADLAELPAHTVGDALLVRDVVRLGNGREGPGIAVRKHEGAPVLDAIATRVEVRTGVASEGVLRTRARVHLRNLGLQFLKVALPRGSELVGAVVDGKSVKPLVDGEGVLRVPVPRSRSQGQVAVADLTYDTPLGKRATGRVRVRAPVFPGLEVLETRQDVAFDPGLEIARVDGDFGAARVPRGARFRPWIAGLVGVLANSMPSGLAAKGADAGATVSDAMPQAETKAPAYGLYAEERSKVLEAENVAARQRLAAPARRAIETEAGSPSLITSQFEARDEEVLRLQQQVARVAELRESLRREALPGDESDGESMPTADLEPSNFAPPGVAAPPVAAGPVADPAAQPAGPPAAGGEGPGDPTRTLPPKLPPRRKGLLSLDVPVLLSPNRVHAERLGSGGVMDLSVVATSTLRARYAFFGLAFFTVALVFATRGRAHAWIAFGTLATLSLLVFAIFGAEGALVATALADAGTALAGVLLLRWIARRAIHGPRAARAAAIALVCAALFASSARADEVAETPAPASPAAPERVYVPYDPADATVPRGEDRVFLPMDTYLALRRLARPDEDPDVVALGRVVALVGARHAVRFEGRNARVTSELTFVKRGDGVVLAALAFRGLAIQRAMLDGAAVPLVMKEGVHHVPLVDAGDHTLVLDWVAPVEVAPDRKRLAFSVPPFAASELSVVAAAFDGRVDAEGASVLSTRREGAPPTTFARIALGSLSDVRLTLQEREPGEPEVPLRTRAESRVVHSVRDGGTQSHSTILLHVLQGEARDVEISVPDGVEVLSVTGKAVARWEGAPGGVRILFAAPVGGQAQVEVRALRAASKPARSETLPSFAVRGATGERGTVVVNASPFLRVEPQRTAGLLRTATPRDDAAKGVDEQGRVAGAWTFAARPTDFAIRTVELEPRLTLDTHEAVVFGGDRVQTHLAGQVGIDPRRPVGELVFTLPGGDPVRSVESAGLQAWWTEGEGDGRTLHLRYADLQQGNVAVGVFLDRRLDGRREAIAVPRWSLEGAHRDKGQLVISSLPDVEIAPGALPGLRAVALTPSCFVSPVDRSEPQHAFAWASAMTASLPVALGTPPLEVEAAVVTSVTPSDDVHRLDHLVLFDVRRGLTDAFAVFVPDGGFAADDLVRTRDLREVRRQRVSRRGPDGEAIEGTLYSVRLQAPRGGIVELTVSQTTGAGSALRVLRPEGVRAVQYFGLVRAFLDGEVRVAATAGDPDAADWEDLPFLPTGIERGDVVSFLTSRTPYVLNVTAERHRLEQQAEALVRAAQADLVLGRDGQVRARVTYRLFNRSRQFLRFLLPPEAILYGTTAADRPVKPLEGSGGELLVPIPKVPLGGAGFSVSLLYRAPVGSRLPASDLELVLPSIVGVDVDRTVVRVFAPNDFHYDIETDMRESDATDLAAELAEAAVSEARQILDVAQNGTLEQRQLATLNAGVLVKEAQDLNKLASQKRSGLNRALTQAQRQYDQTVTGLQAALQSRARGDINQGLELRGSNAEPVLTMNTEGTQSAASGETGRQARAQWVFNPAEVGQGAEKQEVKQLKQRLGKALRDRAAEEQSGQADAARSASRPQFGAGEPVLGQLFQGKDASRLNGIVDEKAVSTMNFERLNDALIGEQRKNRQTGVAMPRQLYGYMTQSGAAAQAGDGYGRAGYTTGAALDPSSGIYFEDGDGDGDWRARTENVFDAGLGGLLFAGDGLVDLDDVTSGLEDGAYAQGSPDVRRGLMGVDVALPTNGKIFLFHSPREGSPIRLKAEEVGHSSAVKWGAFLLAVTGLAGLLIGLNRRR